jgi:hypothetical protein
MTRKHFNAIAYAISTVYAEAPTPHVQLLTTKIAQRICDQLQNTNEKFDHQRFIDACTKI